MGDRDTRQPLAGPEGQENFVPPSPSSAHSPQHEKEDEDTNVLLTLLLMHYLSVVKELGLVQTAANEGGINFKEPVIAIRWLQDLL